jgi:hypothetical protein
VTKERLEKLNSIGFDWKQQCGGIAHNKQLEDEKNEHMDPLTHQRDAVVTTYPTYVHKLPTEHHFNNRQKEVLDHTESVVEIKTSDNVNCWDVHFRELVAYLQIHEGFNVPQCDPRNTLLAS